MAYISIEKMLSGEDTSLYRLVLGAASRANELAQGVDPLIETKAKKVTTIALQEIADGVVQYEKTKSKG